MIVIWVMLWGSSAFSRQTYLRFFCMLYLVQEFWDNLNNVNKSRAPPSSDAHVPIVTFLYFSVCTQVSGSIPSNECIAVKGRIYTILKQIGSGGSSKVRCCISLLDVVTYLHSDI